MKRNDIETKVKNLPDYLIPEILDYIDFLLVKHGSKAQPGNKNENKFKFDWEGGLSELKDQYTAVELQHKALDWR